MTILSSVTMTDCCIFFFFFFQAEDGIRVLTVTGVQTCALPILHHRRDRAGHRRDDVNRLPADFSRALDRHRGEFRRGDRKSTRLNSSHSQISYAVFCLKKKTQTSALALAANNTTSTTRTLLRQM